MLFKGKTYRASFTRWEGVPPLWWYLLLVPDLVLLPQVQCSLCQAFLVLQERRSEACFHGTSILQLTVDDSSIGPYDELFPRTRGPPVPGSSFLVKVSVLMTALRISPHRPGNGSSFQPWNHG